MYRTSVHVQSAVANPPQLQGCDLAASLQAAFDGVNRVAIGFLQRLAGRNAAANRRHRGGEDAVLILEVVDVEFLVGCFHRD